MATAEELEALSAKELHDRATIHAKHHLDVKFFWQLLQAVPAAKAAAGNIDEADEDIEHWSAAVADLFSEHDPELEEGLRPFYIDYLLRHPKG